MLVLVQTRSELNPIFKIETKTRIRFIYLFLVRRSEYGIGFLIPFMCGTGTILIYFVKPKPKVLHKRKELPNIGVYSILPFNGINS